MNEIESTIQYLDDLFSSTLELKSFNERAEYPLTNLKYPIYAFILYFLMIWSAHKYQQTKTFQNIARHKLTKLIFTLHFIALVFISVWIFVFSLINYAPNTLADFVWKSKDWDFPPSVLDSIYIFYWSKFLELFDTLIFIASARPILFLHYYHHSTVLFLTWIFIRGNLPLSLSGVLFNSFVHIIMYSYYAASLHIRNIPYKRLITLLQIVQFMTSFVLFVVFMNAYFTEENVAGFKAHTFSVLFNISYFALFVKLFFSKSKSSSSSSSSSTTTTKGKIENKSQ